MAFWWRLILVQLGRFDGWVTGSESNFIKNPWGSYLVGEATGGEGIPLIISAYIYKSMKCAFGKDKRKC